MTDNDWNSGEFAQAFEEHKNKKEINNVQALLCPTLPDITKNSALFEGSQATPACPSGKSSIMMKSKEDQWNDSDRTAPYWTKTYSSTTLPTKSPTRTDLRSKPGLCDDRPTLGPIQPSVRWVPAHFHWGKAARAWH